MERKRKSTTVSSIRTPTREPMMSRRGLFAILFCILLPPLGILMILRYRIFKPQGRILMTLLSTLIMFGVFMVLLPSQTIQSAAILAVPPVAVTAAPESEVLTALSNLDQILLEQQLANGTPTQAPSTDEQLAAQAAEREAALATTVYCVYSDKARYYHAEPVCNNQSNRRALTVREAMAEGLGACPECKPTVVSFVMSSDNSNITSGDQ